MEQVLDVYAMPPSQEEPLICMDESSKQMLEGLHDPIPAAPGQPPREGYHYRRHGVWPIFLFFDPHRGWRRLSCRESRTRVDWAHEVRRLLDEDYPHARKVRLVCDNLDTHSIASLYQAFPAEEARRLAAPPGDHPHAPERELVERSGDRAVGAGATVPGPSDRVAGGAGLRVRGVGEVPQ